MTFFDRGELHKQKAAFENPIKQGCREKEHSVLIFLQKSERSRQTLRVNLSKHIYIFFKWKGQKNNSSFINQAKYEFNISYIFSHYPKDFILVPAKNSPKGTFTSWSERLCLLVTVNLSLIRTPHMPTRAIITSTFLFTHIWFSFHLVCARWDLYTRLWRNEHHSGSLEGN